MSATGFTVFRRLRFQPAFEAANKAGMPISREALARVHTRLLEEWRTTAPQHVKDRCEEIARQHNAMEQAANAAAWVPGHRFDHNPRRSAAVQPGPTSHMRPFSSISRPTSATSSAPSPLSASSSTPPYIIDLTPPAGTPPPFLPRPASTGREQSQGPYDAYPQDGPVDTSRPQSRSHNPRKATKRKAARSHPYSRQWREARGELHHEHESMLLGPGTQEVAPVPKAAKPRNKAVYIYYPGFAIPEGNNVSYDPHLPTAHPTLPTTSLATRHLARPTPSHPDPTMSSAISPAATTPSTSVSKTQDVTHEPLVSAEDALAAPMIILGTAHQLSDSFSTDGLASASSASTPTSATAPTPDVASPQSPASSDADGHPHWDDVVAFHNAVLPQSSTPPLPDFDIPITWRPRPSPTELLPEDLWPQYIKEWWQGRFASAWDGFEALPPPPQ